MEYFRLTLSISDRFDTEHGSYKSIENIPLGCGLYVVEG